MRIRTTIHAAILLATLVALALLAATAAAAPIAIRSGAELTARTWPDGTELQLPKDQILFIDRPVKWTGRLTVIGNNAWLRNRQGAYAATFNVRAGQTLRIYNATLAQTTMLTLTGWKYNRGIDQAGGHTELRNVWTADGEGAHIEASDSFTWIGGGTSPAVTTYAYTLYAGNNLAGRFADRVYVERCTFRVGRKETAVRVMGAAAVFTNCTFDSNTADGRKHQKESVQPRHGTIDFINCKLNAISAGSLSPTIDGGKHAAYAAEHPTTIRLIKCQIAGYTEVFSNTTLSTDQCVVTPDPRGIGGPAAFNLIPHTWNGRKLQPRGRSTETTARGFGRFASPGWTIDAQSTLNGAPAR